MLEIKMPVNKFTETDGTPLDNGSIYIGEAGLNPVTNQAAIFWDVNGSIPASQPVGTIGGFSVRDGTASSFYTADEYSIAVYNNAGDLVMSDLTATGSSASSVAASVAALLNVAGETDGETIELLSYDAPSYGAAVPFDGGGGLFVWASTQPKANADKIDVFDPSVSLANQGTGIGNGCWVRNNKTFMQTVLSKDVAGGVDVTLTEAEASSGIINLTGIITADINVIFPDYERELVVINNTTGAFTATAKTLAGTGKIVSQGFTMSLYCDGTNIEDSTSDKAPLALPATHTDAINTAKATVASNATTSAIWAAAGNLIDFTGTATITDLPAAPQAGAQRRLVAAAACSFTDNATLDVQGGTQTLSAGDIAVIDAITTTTFKVTFLYAIGIIGGSLIPISAANPSGAATVDFTGLDGTYDHYVFMLKDVLPVTDGASLLVRVGTGATPTWQATNYAYHSQILAGTAATYSAIASTVGTYVPMGNGLGNLATESLSGKLTISGVAATTTHKRIIGSYAKESAAGNFAGGDIVASWAAVTAITGIRFLFTAGNIASGRIALYGVKNV